MNFAELFSNPSMMHAAVVHMPIAAAVFGLLLIGLSAIFHRNNSIRAVTALMFLIASASAYLAIETGEDARELVPNTMPTAVWDQLTAHAQNAENVLYASIFTLICLLISLIRVDTVRIVGLLLAGVGAVAANVFVAQTGHLGGTLVYIHGVGTPFAHQPAAPVAAPVAEAPESPAETAVESGGDMPAETPMVSEAPIEAAVPADNPDWVAIKEFTLEEAQKVSYKNDIWPIIDDQCIVCHEGEDADGDFIMTTLAEMMQGGKKGGPGVVPGKPDESSVVIYIRGIANPRMPEDEPPLPEDMLHKIRMWIAAGAIDDSETAPAEVMKDEGAPADSAAEATPAPAEETAEAPSEAPAPEAAPAEEMKEAAPAPEAAEAVAAPESADSTSEAAAPAETVEESPAEAPAEETKESAPAAEETSPASEEAPAAEESPAAEEAPATEEAPAAETAESPQA